MLVWGSRTSSRQAGQTVAVAAATTTAAAPEIEMAYSHIYTQVKTVPVLVSDQFWEVAAWGLALVVALVCYNRVVTTCAHRAS